MRLRWRFFLEYTRVRALLVAAPLFFALLLPLGTPLWFSPLALAADGGPGPATDQRPAPTDRWEWVRFLEGEWVGRAQGEPGTGTVHRSYQFILNERFLHERNVSAYAPKDSTSAGELHEHWSLLSFDQKRKRLVLRQFHQEGFVNQYVLDPDQSSPKHFVFVSEAFENLDSRWRARETYDIASPDAFTETFEIAPPGEEFTVYSKNTFSRATLR